MKVSSVRDKDNVGRLAEGQWVYGGICRAIKECILVPVEQRNCQTLLDIIEDYIELGTQYILLV